MGRLTLILPKIEKGVKKAETKLVTAETATFEYSSRKAQGTLVMTAQELARG